jgi:transposase-like protein
MEPRKIRGEADARSCLAAAAQSGVPRVAWAQEHGIDARSLNAWRVNLARAGGPRVGQASAAAPPGLRLVELVAVAPPAPPAYRVRCGLFEVEVAGEIDPGRLGQLLRVMAAAC